MFFKSKQIVEWKNVNTSRKKIEAIMTLYRFSWLIREANEKVFKCFSQKYLLKNSNLRLFSVTTPPSSKYSGRNLPKFENELRMNTFSITESKPPLPIGRAFVRTKHFSHILTGIIFELNYFMSKKKQKIVDFQSKMRDFKKEKM